MSNTAQILKNLFNAADAHGEDSGEPDHTVGDLQGLVTLMWGLLTPSQRVAVLESSEVEELAVAGAQGDWDETDLVELHLQDMAALDARMRDLGYTFLESELGVRWETTDEVDVEQPTHEDALWAAFLHYTETRRQCLLDSLAKDFQTHLDDETGRWHAARTQPVTLREHLGMTTDEYSLFVKDPVALEKQLRTVTS